MASNKAFEVWWTEQTKKGDPQRNPRLVQDAYEAGMRAGQIQADLDARDAAAEALWKERQGDDSGVFRMPTWIDVKMFKPPCKRDPDALGTPVLIWPRNPQGDKMSGVDGHCYYGRRVTGKPEFYKYGAIIRGVKFWQPMPSGPTSEDD